MVHLLHASQKYTVIKSIQYEKRAPVNVVYTTHFLIKPLHTNLTTFTQFLFLLLSILLSTPPPSPHFSLTEENHGEVLKRARSSTNTRMERRICQLQDAQETNQEDQVLKSS